MPIYNPHTNDYELRDEEFDYLAQGTEANRALGAANRARVLALSKSGLSAAQIAQETGLHFTSVYRHLRSMGVPGVRVQRRELAERMILAGVSREEIATTLGLVLGTVHNYASQLANAKRIDPLLL